MPLADIELKHGSSGQFDVFIDGRLAFTKAAVGRFPSDAEIDALPGA
ncbi:MAG: Rdx family protein [Alphaproteobacteria bacterium]|nr:Rdx family protein [Alphaproteobacteria bacterium]